MGIGSAIAEKDLGDRKTTMEEFTKGLKDTRHGDNGTYTTPDGSQYHGQWRWGAKHGVGRFQWSDGSKYEGEWSDNRQHGEGRFVWADGNEYNGSWQQDLRHGWGVFVEDGHVLSLDNSVGHNVYQSLWPL
mmetsp:Transcript_25275/g.34745  ORF Transcript_25275/g.34745 Transcript_25275/m.34745 type:complete len:131 (+) Transcript_25275:420-812(+)